MVFERAELLNVNGIKIQTYLNPPPPDGECLIVLNHGAGSSALTFAELAVELKHVLDKPPGVLTYDMRGHGKTALVNPSDPPILDIELLVKDLREVLNQTLQSINYEKGLILLGHSLGGTIVSRLTRNAGGLRISGLAVLEAVEDYAVKSLKYMPQLLNSWPSSFESVDAAIKWSLGPGHQLRRRSSAEKSVPALLTQHADGRWYRILDLGATQRYWGGWFKGLDSDFVNASVGRLLVLAGTSRLDKALTIAQMQGKFQLLLMPECGHYVHEDEPLKVATALAEMLQRVEKVSTIVPKFGKFRD